jgi:hypothetical protein
MKKPVHVQPNADGTWTVYVPGSKGDEGTHRDDASEDFARAYISLLERMPNLYRRCRCAECRGES